jgi:glycerol uptake facilitator protein
MLSSLFMSELLGSAILCLLGCGVVATTHLPKSKGLNGGWLLINVGWGLAVFAGVYVAYKSGGHINPAVTFGLFVAGVDFHKDVAPTVAHLFLYWAAQLIGAFIGAVFMFLAFKKHFDQEPDGGTKLACFVNHPALRTFGWNFVTEVIGTFVLVFWVLVSGKTPSGLGPLAAALIIVSIGASLGGPTGYSINPTRDLGPRIAHAVLPMYRKGTSDWAYSWVPFFGPLVGGGLAGGLGLLYVV